jgi:hypothetical protein
VAPARPTPNNQRLLKRGLRQVVDGMSADLVRVKLVKDVENWDGSLHYHKDLELLVDLTAASALVLSCVAVKVSGQPLPESGPA